MESARMGKCDKRMDYAGLIVGVGTIILGLVISWMLPKEAKAYESGSSMLSGFGTGILFVTLMRYFRNRFGSSEKRREREIEQKDERNVMIRRTAYTIAGVVAYLLMAVMSIVFTFLGEYKASWICIGALYLDLFIFAISYRILQKKM